MPYYINPVTGTIEKITKSQKGALDEYYRSQSFDSFIGSNFGAPTLALSFFVVAAPIILAGISQFLKKADPDFDFEGSLDTQILESLKSGFPSFALFTGLPLKAMLVGMDIGKELGTDPASLLERLLKFAK